MTIVNRDAAPTDPSAPTLAQSRPMPFRSESLRSEPLAPVRLHFTGDRDAYARLMIRGAVLLAVTLGIYRFWLFTDMRRFLWENTEIGDESFEYAGTAIELLLGFLLAIGILIPVYALLFLGKLGLGADGRVSTVVAFVSLAGFGQYAAYQARRYRLSRTVWRGLRFHQTGSPLRFAVWAVMWSIMVAATLGLLYPWMQANLERFKMRNTFYGDLGGSFAGSGTRLFGRGILMWVVTVLPLVYVAAHAAVFVDWAAVGRAGGLRNQPLVALQQIDSFMAAARLFIAGLTWSVFSAIILYPAFQATVMRWWLSGLRLGGAAAASDLPKHRFYAVYLRFVLFVFLFSIVFILFAVVAAAVDRAVLSSATVVAGATTVAFVVYVLGCSTLYQVIVKLALWRTSVESVAVSGFAQLGRAHASEATSSAMGEGLADALGGGAI
jgi:uncharacterized membrane protein YjgN (DUF898 family)